MKYSKIIELIRDAKKGKMFILVDDENRENEGDFVAAAEKATPEMLLFENLDLNESFHDKVCKK